MNAPDKCLIAVAESKSLKTATCSNNDLNQRWLWGYTNTSALENWKAFGVELQKCQIGEIVSFACENK